MINLDGSTRSRSIESRWLRNHGHSKFINPTEKKTFIILFLGNITTNQNDFMQFVIGINKRLFETFTHRSNFTARYQFLIGIFFNIQKYPSRKIVFSYVIYNKIIDNKFE